MLRLNRIVIILIVLWLISTISFLLLSKCKLSSTFPYLERSHNYFSGVETATNQQLSKTDTIKCIINGESTIECIKKDSSVYFPFTFLQNYFEIYGKFEIHENEEKFFMSHSYSKVFIPEEAYSSAGAFMNFHAFNVETRDRVKCISAKYGVPISTQWSSDGYFYPIQIAQLGLSHYSKLLLESPPEVEVIEDADKYLGSWASINGHLKNNIERRFDPVMKSHIMTFNIADTGLHLSTDISGKLVLVAKLKLDIQSALEITIQESQQNRYKLVYTSNDIPFSVNDNKILHGLGNNSWVQLARYLTVDLKKGYNAMKLKKKISPGKIRIRKISLYGKGSIDHIKFATSAHEEQFLIASQWLLTNQDKEGKWKTNVRRKLIKNVLELEPGWCSAMGQGQSMSLMIRTYTHTNNKKYLDCALKGLQPFKVNSSDGGVRAYLFDKFPWYEEYPTTPGSFVLNGFMFSLLGLFDVYNTTNNAEAKRLFYEGLESLKQVLLLYDTGSGTIYDMRHISLSLPPNIARWDYHSTHINQLYTLATIDKDPIFETTANRWLDYMKGHRASHN